MVTVAKKEDRAPAEETKEPEIENALPIPITSSSVRKYLAEVPELASLPPLWKAGRNAVQLTEKETEYVVTCLKHIFEKNLLVLQVQRCVFPLLMFTV